MAILKLNDLFQALSGTVGDLTLSTRHHRIVARQKPRPKIDPTAAQLAHQARFKEAAAYGRTVRDNPALAAVYTPLAQARGLAPYHVALADFFNAPSVTEIDLSGLAGGAGKPIRVRAQDDFEVVAVAVSLLTVQGVVIERGDAQRDALSGDWLYLTQGPLAGGQALLVEASALDRPGHRASHSLVWWVE
jgi:hypothetical protein